jgi:tryptophan synthase beta chain
VRDFHSCIGRETRRQAQEQWGGKPDILVACVGGGSNAMGLFNEFVEDEDVRLIGVEAGEAGGSARLDVPGCAAVRARVTTARTALCTAAQPPSRRAPCAGGEGVNTPKHAATLTLGKPGVLHGSYSLLIQDEEGQVVDPHSISAG